MAMISLTVWYANWSEFRCSWLNHALWTMADANSSDYIGVCVRCVYVCMCVCRERRQMKKCGSAMRDLLFVPVLHDDMFSL